MSKVIDEKLKEFIDKELGFVNSDKDRITEEKRRIRTEIFQLFKIDCLKRSDEQKEKLEFFRQYESVLIEQYSLLCKRDIAIFGLIANIGEAAIKESQGACTNGVLEDNELDEYQTEEYDQVI